ncbi:MAG: IMP dehydrogenase, partial [Betaproteobacteria bacterium]|nr:IMP dehydrogenase [Betaproteobacteria bacterium]
LLAGEGHIPLACTPSAASAAPVSGGVDPCESTFGFEMNLTRIHEDPRVTRPFDDAQWQALDRLGHRIDAELAAGDVRLTQGGEPTFVSIDDMDGAEWNTAALSDRKWQLAEELAWRLHRRFAPGGLVFHGQGKWYPGEPLPRWALGIQWRNDGVPLWQDPALIAAAGSPADAEAADARRFAEVLLDRLGLTGAVLMPAWEDPLTHLSAEKRLRAPGGTPAAWVLSLGADAHGWTSTPWPLPDGRLIVINGDSAAGYRLPLNLLPELIEDRRKLVRTALCVEVRSGRLHVFMPPFESSDPYFKLLSVIEKTAESTRLQVRLEGYPPPQHPRITVLNVTPDPGVIEVNIHPAKDWPSLAANTTALYEEARLARLGTEKFMLDGRHTGSGGGNHITLGGATAADSPLLRRPDLLRSLITYWQNHPSLSYLFSGMFIGPTSQAPRVDEARDDNLYELEIAFQEMARLQAGSGAALPPEMTDRLLRNFLVDLTGNTHRAEFCIDKLYTPAGGSGRLGLLEFRGFEMPPHARMSLAQMLLLRGLVAWFWREPYTKKLVRWGTQLHDRFMLPHFVGADFYDVLGDLRRAGYGFEDSWYAAFHEFRFPRYGTVVYNGIEVELRQAIEPWHVLGEEVGLQGTARYVDSSVERLQVRARGLAETRHLIACNGRALPLTPTGTPGEFVAGLRYCAWNPPSALHPTIGVHAPLVFDVVDTWSGRSIGGCTYHVAHPGGRNYETLPVNANEAEARRIARFWDHGHSPGPMTVRPEPPNPAFPLTLDLRWQPAPAENSN